MERRRRRIISIMVLRLNKGVKILHARISISLQRFFSKSRLIFRLSNNFIQNMEWRRKRIISITVPSFFVHHVRKSRGNSLILQRFFSKLRLVFRLNNNVNPEYGMEKEEDRFNHGFFFLRPSRS